ncbi:MAG: F0F1 ATP synthase subunit B [Duncaniella sp.]|nr:F0F1 ATP synthase subunit B [Duncaniella sp.]
MELFTPDFGLVFWMFVSFGVLFVVLWRWGWPAIMKGVSDRADLIDKGVEYAQNAKQQLDKAQESAAELMADAARRQAEMLREADRMKTQIIEEARNAAKQEAQKEMDAAKVAIEQDRKRAQEQFKTEVSTFALDIAQKVVRKQMEDQKAQQELVSSLIDEMETAQS